MITNLSILLDMELEPHCHVDLLFRKLVFNVDETMTMATLMIGNSNGGDHENCDEREGGGLRWQGRLTAQQQRLLQPPKKKKCFG